MARAGPQHAAMRFFSRLLAVAFVAAAISLAAQAPPVPTLVLFNGRIHTLDAANTTVEALAIAGDRIVATGTSAAMRALAGPDTRVIDLGGRAAMPGLMDNHLHGAGGGPGVDLSRARSLADVAAAVAARVQDDQARRGDRLQQRLARRPAARAAPAAARRPRRGRAAQPGRTGARRPRVRGEHDGAAPLGDRRAHGRAGRRADHEVSRRAAERRTRGHGQGPGHAAGAARPVARRADRRPPGRIRQACTPPDSRPCAIRASRWTTTGCCRRCSGAAPLTMRVNALLRPGGDPAAVLAALDGSGLHDGDGDAWLRVGGVKLAVDGGFEGGLMREPYDEPWGEGGAFKGLQIMTRPAFEQVVAGPQRARLARGHPRRGRRRHRPRARHLREGACGEVNHRAPLVDSSTPSSAVPITCRGSRRWAWRSPSRITCTWPGRAWWPIGARRGRP